MKRWCYYCRHGGKPFRLDKLGTHLHCQHPDPDVAFGPGQHDGKLPYSGWASVRRVWEKCGKFESKDTRP